MLAAGDINGDGITDLAATGRQQLTVWFGTGGGAFGAPHTTMLYDGAVALGIADADGYPGDELYVTTGLYFYVFTWFVNDFNQLYVSSIGPNTGMATKDIDGDGHIDAVGAYDDGYEFLGTVDGATGYGNIGGDGSVAGLALANVDSDAKPDAILALPATAQLAVYSKVQNSPEDATTHVHATELWSVTTGTPRFVAAADLDADGTSEVMAGMPDTMRLQLFHRGGAAGTTIQLSEPMSRSSTATPTATASPISSSRCSIRSSCCRRPLPRPRARAAPRARVDPHLRPLRVAAQRAQHQPARLGPLAALHARPAVLVIEAGHRVAHVGLLAQLGMLGEELLVDLALRFSIVPSRDCCCMRLSGWTRCSISGSSMKPTGPSIASRSHRP